LQQPASILLPTILHEAASDILWVQWQLLMCWCWWRRCWLLLASSWRNSRLCGISIALPSRTVTFLGTNNMVQVTSKPIDAIAEQVTKVASLDSPNEQKYTSNH
jgi:hypothetical protein